MGSESIVVVATQNNHTQYIWDEEFEHELYFAL